MFRGRYSHTIDPKGRLSIPAKFREVLKNGYGGRLVVVPDEHCLEVYPLEEWEQRIEAKMRDLPVFNPEAKMFGRLYVSKAKDADLDGQGRILLPPDLRAEVALAKEVTFVGGGRTHFEIWDRQRFEEFQRVHQEEFSTVAEKLAEFGV